MLSLGLKSGKIVIGPNPVLLTPSVYGQKRKFDKQLKAHRTKLKEEYSSRIVSDPKLIWKARLSEPAAGKPHDSISEKDWESYFSNEFSAPDPNTSNPFANRLESVLSNQCVPDFVVTYGSVHEAILKLKKK